MKAALVIRPALPLDRAAILALSRDIWDGGDYLHYVVDDWLEDTNSLFCVGEYAGRLVTVARAKLQLPGAWWFEGMRVHPDFEGHGFATRLMRYLSQAVRQRGAHTARLVTASSRLAVHHICQREGWRKTAEFAPFRAPALAGQAAVAFAPLAQEEADAAYQAAQGWQDAGAFSGLMDLGWEWSPVHPLHLRRAASEGRAWWWQGASGERKGVLSVWYDEEDNSKDMKIELAACAPGDLPALLLAYRGLAAELGLPEACANLPVLEPALAAAQAAGYRRTWDKSLLVFEVVMERHPG
jgi:GNAT superfamily N-acetyltransferase